MIKGINALSKVTEFVGWEECLDFVYIPEKLMVVFTIRISERKGQIYVLDYELYDSKNTHIKIPITDDMERTVKRQLDNLFIRTKLNQITIYTNINPQLNCRLLRIKNVPGSGIADFSPCGANRLITVSHEGTMTIYEFSLSGLNYGRIGEVGELQLDKKETCSCVDVCLKGRFLVITTKIKSKTANWRMGRILLFDLKDNSFKLIGTSDHRSQVDPTLQDSYFRSVSLYYYHGEYPLVVANSYLGDNSLHMLFFNGRKLVEYNEPCKIHNSYGSSLTVCDEKLMSVDENGNISRLEFR